MNLIAAEWLKLTRRPMAWVLLAIFLGILAVQTAAQYFFALLLSGGSLSGELSLQAAEYVRRSVLPGALGSALGHLNGLGGIFAVVLAAGAMGGEYGWGTLRTQLARQPDRAAFLLAKLAALMLMLAAAGLITVLLAGLLGLAVGAVGGPSEGLRPEHLALAILGLARALLVLLPYVLLTLCFTILGRSLLAGVAGGLIYLALEGGFGALAVFARLGGIWQLIYSLTIGQNINTLVVLNAHDFGLRPELFSPLDLDTLPSPLQATAVVIVYSASLLATAIWLLRRRDVGGPG